MILVPVSTGPQQQQTSSPLVKYDPLREGMFPGIPQKIAALETQPVTSGLFFFWDVCPKNRAQDYILQFGFQAANAWRDIPSR